MIETRERFRILNSPPLSFRFVKWLQRNGLPGGHRLEKMYRASGLWDVTVRYPLKNSIMIHIPWINYRNSYKNIMDYERKSIDYMRTIISRFSEPVLLIDCGADIGLMSLRLISECPNIRRVIAF